jgi:signal transduction histidine kinase
MDVVTNGGGVGADISRVSSALAKRVLVVDDEPALRAVLGKALTTMGRVVEFAEDGLAALTALRPEIDLVLLDVSMPGMDGFETARRMRQHSTAGDVPIIIVTGQDGRAERLMAVEAGASDFIGKPVDLTELRVRTASLLRLKEAQDTAKRYREELEELVAARTAALVIARDEALATSRAKSALLGRMSHEFRTPLNHILGLSDLLLSQMDEDGRSDYAADVRDIHTAGQHLLGIATDVLEFADMEAGRTSLDVSVVRIADLLGEVKTAACSLAADNANDLEFVVPLDIGDVCTDPQKVYRVLLSLVNNACKFMQGGRVRVEAARQDGLGIEWLVVTVSDTGIGMSPEQCRSACNAFWQAEEMSTRRFEGAGLGLTVARRLCELLGGDLRLDSEIGKGTMATVRIPTMPPTKRA